MNDIDRFDWGTPFRVYRPPISTDGSHIIEKFDTLIWRAPNDPLQP